MMAVDARFRLGLISVDWMIDNHVEPTIIVRDGRDQEHEDWWEDNQLKEELCLENSHRVGHSHHHHGVRNPLDQQA